MLFWVISLFPLSVARCVGYRAGEICWLIQARIARTTAQNIKYCYSSLSAREQRRLTRASLRHTACIPFDSAWIWHASQRRLERRIVELEGHTALVELLKDQGVLVLLPHFGSWEILNWYLGKHFGERATVLYDRRRLGYLDELVTKYRSRYGMNMVAIDYQGLRRLLTNAKAGQLISVLPDQVPTRGRSVTAPFMNHLAQTTTLPHALLKRSDLKVVFITALRVSNGFRFRIENAPEAIYDADSRISAESMNAAIERIIEEAPEQYQWEYKRFRRIADIYQ